MYNITEFVANALCLHLLCLIFLIKLSFTDFFTSPVELLVAFPELSIS